ncbi:MAG: response regulator [Bdellovibrionota bacterium]|nr:response regulator [Bdellovibrionota bacterium]
MEVLIVDDSETVRIKLRNALEGSGLIIYEASDGLEGLGVLEERKTIKLIVSDLNMPGLSGLDFIELARAFNEFKEIPVLFVSTEATDSLKQKAKDLGVRAWMQKPIALEKVANVIHRVLGELKGA